MKAIQISAEDLLAGAATSYTLEVPEIVLKPGLEPAASKNGKPQKVEVEIKPLTIGAFQLIAKAAQDDPGLVPILMIKEGLLNPKLSPAQIASMHIGLVEFLIENIRRISGLSQKKIPGRTE